MAHILITGGGGFLGSYISERLLQEGHAVKVIDVCDGTKVEPLLSNPRFRFIRDSIFNIQLMKDEMEDIDILFHFAAIADPKRYVLDPLNTLEIDLQATLHLLKIAAQNKTKVIFASTSEIYGKNPQVPWKENADRVLGATSINRWCYATSKAAGEHYCYAYYQQKKMPFVIVRFFNVYGPRLDDLGYGRVIPIFLKQFLDHKPITIHGGGSQTRTFVYVDDVAEAIIKLAFLDKAVGEVFNIGSAEEISILQLFHLINEIGGFEAKYVQVPYKDAFGISYEDIPRRVPDVSKIKEFTGWVSTTPLPVGLKKTIEYYRQSK